MASLINICTFDYMCAAEARYQYIWEDKVNYYVCDFHKEEADLNAVEWNRDVNMPFKLVELWPV